MSMHRRAPARPQLKFLSSKILKDKVKVSQQQDFPSSKLSPYELVSFNTISSYVSCVCLAVRKASPTFPLFLHFLAMQWTSQKLQEKKLWKYSLPRKEEEGSSKLLLPHGLEALINNPGFVNYLGDSDLSSHWMLIADISFANFSSSFAESSLNRIPISNFF